MNRYFTLFVTSALLTTTCFAGEYDFSKLSGGARDIYLQMVSNTSPQEIANTIHNIYGIKVSQKAPIKITFESVATTAIQNVKNNKGNKNRELTLLKMMDGRGVLAAENDGNGLNKGVRVAPAASESEKLLMQNAIYELAKSTLTIDELKAGYEAAIAQVDKRYIYHPRLLYYAVLNMRCKMKMYDGMGDDKVTSVFGSSWDFNKDAKFAPVRDKFDTFALGAYDREFKSEEINFRATVKLAGYNLPSTAPVDKNMIEAYEKLKGNTFFQTLANGIQLADFNHMDYGQDFGKRALRNNGSLIFTTNSNNNGWVAKLPEAEQINTFMNTISLLAPYLKEKASDAFLQRIANYNAFLIDFIRDAGINNNEIQNFIDNPMNHKLLYSTQAPYSTWNEGQREYFRNLISLMKPALEYPVSFRMENADNRKLSIPKAISAVLSLNEQEDWKSTIEHIANRKTWLTAVLDIVKIYGIAKSDNQLGSFFNGIVHDGGACSPARLRSAQEWLEMQELVKNFEGIRFISGGYTAEDSDTALLLNIFYTATEKAFLITAVNSGIELREFVDWVIPYAIHQTAFKWQLAELMGEHFYNQLNQKVVCPKMIERDSSGIAILAKNISGQYVFDQILTNPQRGTDRDYAFQTLQELVIGVLTAKAGPKLIKEINTIDKISGKSLHTSLEKITADLEKELNKERAKGHTIHIETLENDFSAAQSTKVAFKNLQDFCGQNNIVFKQTTAPNVYETVWPIFHGDTMKYPSSKDADAATITKLNDARLDRNLGNIRLKIVLNSSKTAVDQIKTEQANPEIFAYLRFRTNQTLNTALAKLRQDLISKKVPSKVAQ